MNLLKQCLRKENYHLQWSTGKNHIEFIVILNFGKKKKKRITFKGRGRVVSPIPRLNNSKLTLWVTIWNSLMKPLLFLLQPLHREINILLFISVMLLLLNCQKDDSENKEGSTLQRYLGTKLISCSSDGFSIHWLSLNKYSGFVKQWF